MDIQQLFAETARLAASDLHLLAGFPPTIRVNGTLVSLEGTKALTGDELQTLVSSILTDQQRDIYLTNRELDFSVDSPVGRFRANVYYQKNTVAAAFRLVPATIKPMRELGLPSVCDEFVKLRQGFVLVTGPTGHGKSTTLASMINVINQTRAVHVVTIEDPIEYVYPKGLSIVSQREMHGDTHAWSIALRSVLREDPDVVLIGEMRDFETMQAALTVAETGHLVFATLHTNSAAQTVDRIVDVFPQHQQAQVRMQLALVLEGVLSLRLVPAASGGRVLISEILTATPAVRTTIREGKTHLLDNIIQTSAEMGMTTLEAALARAVQEGKVGIDVATTYAIRPEEMARYLKSQNQ